MQRISWPLVSLAVCAVWVSAAPALADNHNEIRFRCMSKTECTTATWCRTHLVENDLVVLEDRKVLKFGAVGDQVNPLEFKMTEPTSFAKYVGLLSSSGQVSASTFTLFDNMEFFLTSVVDIQDGSGRTGVGLLIQGNCFGGAA